jgi:hypothetical protein
LDNNDEYTYSKIEKTTTIVTQNPTTTKIEIVTTPTRSTQIYGAQPQTPAQSQ